MNAVQFGFAAMDVIMKVASNQGVTPTIIGFGYVLDRKTNPILTFTSFCGIFVSALIGSTLNQKFYPATLCYTSAIFICALSNMVAAEIAIYFRKRGGTRTVRAKANLLGTTICFGGALLVTLCKEITLKIRSISLKRTGRTRFFLIMFLLTMSIAVASGAAVNAVDDPGDKLPSDCQTVDSCGLCLQCDRIEGGFNCCN